MTVKASVLRKRRTKLLQRQVNLNLRYVCLCDTYRHPSRIAWDVWRKKAADCAVRMKETGMAPNDILEEALIEDVMET